MLIAANATNTISSRIAIHTSFGTKAFFTVITAALSTLPPFVRLDYYRVTIEATFERRIIVQHLIWITIGHRLLTSRAKSTVMASETEVLIAASAQRPF